MDYSKMTKDEINEIINDLIYKPMYEEWKKLEKEYEKYRGLTESNTLFDRLDKELKNPYLDSTLKRKYCFVRDNYQTFKAMDRFCEIFLNKDNYSKEDQDSVFGRIPYYISLTKKNHFDVILSILGPQKKEIVEYLYEIEKINSKSIFDTNNSYDKAEIKDDLKLIKKVGTLLIKSKNFKKNCIYLYDFLGIDHGNFEIRTALIKKLYVKSIIENKDEYNVKNNVDLQDLFYIDKYIKEFNRFEFKYERYYLNKKASFATTRETLKHYCKIIDNYMSNNNKIGVMEKIVDEYKLLLTHFDVFFEGDYKNYVHAVLTGMEPKNDFKIADIFDIEEFYEDYQLLLKRVCYGALYMDRFGSDEKKIIEVSKKARFFNKMNPSSVKQFITKNRSELRNYELNYLNKYIDEYSVEYFDQKKSKNVVKQEVKAMPKTDYLDKYVLKIQEYLDSKVLDIVEYLELNDIDKKDFDRAVEILKKEKHPKYYEYIAKSHNAAKDFKKKNKKDAETITKLLDSGIKQDNGETRDFDLVDYYEITKVKPEVLYNSIIEKSAMKSSAGIDKTLCRFLKSYMGETKITKMENLYRHTFSFEKNENNIPIFTEETEEDKLKAIESLIEKKVPITQGTYRAMVKRVMRERVKEKGKQKVKD